MNEPTPQMAEHSLPESYHALVLLVDDHAFVADAVRRALAQQQDIDFHYCGDPAAAIEMANNIRPTVILLDLVMPQIGGLVLLRRFRENPGTAETPIVVLSAREEARTKSEAFALGANDYLVKLPDTLELRARVRYHSKAYLNRVQREEAFKALRASQQQLVKTNAELSIANQDLGRAIAEVKQLRGLLPICYSCKKVRDDQNYWHQLEAYIAEHSDLTFSQSLCPDCFAQEMKWIDQTPPTADDCDDLTPPSHS